MTRRLQILVILAICTVLVDAWVSYRSVRALLVQERSTSTNYARLNALETTLSAVKDAETGQRGYLITGDDRYLEPYTEASAALETHLVALRTVWPADTTDVDNLIRLVHAKLAELHRVIDVRRSSGFEAARASVLRGQGRLQMDSIRAVVGTLRDDQHRRLAEDLALSAAARRTVFNTVVLSSTIALAFIGVCVVMLKRDLAQRARVAEERAVLLRNERQARDEAERANRLKDDFLATLSHELRNPLHAVVGWLQLLRRQPDDHALLVRGIETVDRNARVLHRMIEDLLDASRASRGKLTLKLSPTPVAPLVASVLETLRPGASERGVSLTDDVAIDATVIGDSDRLAQVVMNLVSNAIKFTPSGGRVSVGLERSERDAVLTVTDTGRGISASALPYIFEAFRQIGPRMSGSEGGLGLGLSIAKHIVDLHGGTIAAESDGDGAGATFTVTLPLARSATPPVPQGA